MYPGIHNFSEIGKLNKVLLHRPGLELEALTPTTVSYTHLRAHETGRNLVCRLLLEKKKNIKNI